MFEITLEVASCYGAQFTEGFLQRLLRVMSSTPLASQPSLQWKYVFEGEGTGAEVDP
jgi:hypothetical protein